VVFFEVRGVLTIPCEKGADLDVVTGAEEGKNWGCSCPSRIFHGRFCGQPPSRWRASFVLAPRLACPRREEGTKRRRGRGRTELQGRHRTERNRMVGLHFEMGLRDTAVLFVLPSARTERRRGRVLQGRRWGGLVWRFKAPLAGGYSRPTRGQWSASTADPPRNAVRLLSCTGRGGGDVAPLDGNWAPRNRRPASRPSPSRHVVSNRPGDTEVERPFRKGEKGKRTGTEARQSSENGCWFWQSLGESCWYS